MRTLRGRLILSHILPLLLVIPLVGVALIVLLETQVLLTEIADGLTEQADIIASAVFDRPELLNDPERAQAFVAGASVRMENQVMLIGPNGEIVASSSIVSQEPIDRPLDLEGFETAQSGEMSVNTIYSVTEQRVEVLVPITDANQQLIGIVSVTETLQGVASFFSRLRWAIRLQRSISRVSTAVFEIAQGQRIDPIPVEGPEEIRQLSASVNTLAQRLRELEDTRRRLLANLVHEIGRPLGALRSAIHALRGGASNDPEIRDELLSGMEEEVKRMQPLLDDLAQLHGQVLGTLELDRQSIDLSNWLPSILFPWRAAALDKGLEWHATIPDDLPTIDVDPDRLAQAIGNLLSNAIKYTSEEGKVRVTAGASEHDTWIEVDDTGPGIVLSEQEQVFEPFFRSRQERRFPQGLGLGLTIARDLVEAHGGTLELDSRPGEGSRFTIHLPNKTEAGLSKI
jgi:signal transduction histidine kinase